ncbi:hypothetical protein DDW11_03615 [Sulfolobus sp. SCGC AB-777_G06]|nr:hypothetical protein DDW11_03615 [Sulfolobus sp. SCGC AB-777_G06]
MINMVEFMVQDNLSFFTSKVFDVLAQAFHYPYKLKDVQNLRNNIHEIEVYISSFCNENVKRAFHTFKSLVDGITDIDKLTDVEIQFVELDKPYNTNLSLYESIQRTGYYDLIIVSDLRNIYNLVGLNSKEEPDHISTEFGFLSLMYLLKSSRNEKVDDIIDFFLETHVKKWVPTLLSNLAQSNYPYFKILAEFTKEFMRCIGIED